MMYSFIWGDRISILLTYLLRTVPVVVLNYSSPLKSSVLPSLPFLSVSPSSLSFLSPLFYSLDGGHRVRQPGRQNLYEVHERAQLLTRVWLFATPWTVACQAPLSVECSEARTLEWVAISYFRGSSQPRDPTHVSWIFCAGRWIWGIY